MDRDEITALENDIKAELAALEVENERLDFNEPAIRKDISTLVAELATVRDEKRRSQPGPQTLRLQEMRHLATTIAVLQKKIKQLNGEARSGLRCTVVGPHLQEEMKRLAGEMEILIKKKHRLKLACRPGQVSHQAECPPANDEEDLIDGQMASPSADGETEPPVHDFAAGILEMLFAQEQQVVRMRFGIGFPCSHTLEEIGQAMHLTRERIRQIEAKVLQRLSDPERARRLRALMAAR